MLTQEIGKHFAAAGRMSAPLTDNPRIGQDPELLQQSRECLTEIYMGMKGIALAEGESTKRDELAEEGFFLFASAYASAGGDAHRAERIFVKLLKGVNMVLDRIKEKHSPNSQ